MHNASMACPKQERPPATAWWLGAVLSLRESSLVALEEIARVHLIRHVRELVAPAVGHDDGALTLEGLKVMGDLAAEEVLSVQRGLVDHHGHALGLHALHDALDGGPAEVVGVRFHRQAVDATTGFGLPVKTQSQIICSTSSATKSLRVRLVSICPREHR